MKTFTEFKEYLQEKKAKGKSEYKKSELDDQINQAIEDAKSDGNTEDLNKLEAIRTEKDPDVALLEVELSELFGSETVVNWNKRGKGSLVINFHSLDELDGIMKRIK